MGSTVEKIRIIVKKTFYDGLTSGTSEPRTSAINTWKATRDRGLISRSSNDDVWGQIEVNNFKDLPDEFGTETWAVPDATDTYYTVPDGSDWAFFTTDMLLNPTYGLFANDTNWQTEEV